MVRPLIQSSKAAGGHLAFGPTPRQREVLTLVVAGYGNKDIAREFGVSQSDRLSAPPFLFRRTSSFFRTFESFITGPRVSPWPSSRRPGLPRQSSLESCHTWCPKRSHCRWTARLYRCPRRWPGPTTEDSSR